MHLSVCLGYKLKCSHPLLPRLDRVSRLYTPSCMVSSHLGLHLSQTSLGAGPQCPRPHRTMPQERTLCRARPRPSHHCYEACANADVLEYWSSGRASPHHIACFSMCRPLSVRAVLNSSVFVCDGHVVCGNVWCASIETRGSAPAQFKLKSWVRSDIYHASTLLSIIHFVPVLLRLVPVVHDDTSTVHAYNPPGAA